jgi:hypothetical protein
VNADPINQKKRGPEEDQEIIGKLREFVSRQANEPHKGKVMREVFDSFLRDNSHPENSIQSLRKLQ